MPILLILFGGGVFTIFKKAKQQRQILIDKIRDVVHDFVLQAFALSSLLIGAMLVFIVQKGLFLGLLYSAILLGVVYVVVHLKVKELQPKYENINEYLRLHTGLFDDVHLMLKTDLGETFQRGFGIALAVIVTLLFLGSGVGGMFFGGLIIAGIMYILGILDTKFGWTKTCEELMLKEMEIMYEEFKADMASEAKNAIVDWFKGKSKG